MLSNAFVDDLKYRDILSIARCMEKYGSCDGWHEIAKQIGLLKNNISICEIDYLKHGYSIEESACWNFLQSLHTKHSICNTTMFREIAIKFRRMDICNFIDGLGEVTKNIWELSITQQKELVYYLDRKLVCRYGWKMFADELDYSATEINDFNLRFQQFERPTVLLFNMLIKDYPKMELQEICLLCNKANRNDVANVINTLRKKIIESKSQ